MSTRGGNLFKRKTFWIVLVVLVLAGSGSYGVYALGLASWFAPDQTAEEGTTLQTAAVTVGDLSVTAEGSGMLVPSSEVDLAFGTSGTLQELLAEVGDAVQAGDVLGWIDDTDARKAVADAELGVLQAEEALEDAQDIAGLAQAVAQAELQVAQAEADLETAQSDLEDLLNWAADETDVVVAKANLAVAQASYQDTVARAGMREEQLASARINLEQAVRDLEDAQEDYVHAMDAAHDWEQNIEDRREGAAETLQKAQDSLEIVQANYDPRL